MEFSGGAAKKKFQNNLGKRAFTRLVIRRAVEIESLLQLNLWYLGLVWFYRDFSQVPFQ